MPRSLAASLWKTHLASDFHFQGASERYELEYGTDCLQMHVGAVQPGECVVIMDDLVATGGTLSAAIVLIERAGADVIECACVIGLPKFKVSTIQGKPVFILIDPVS